jgi:hypothetical protein
MGIGVGEAVGLGVGIGGGVGASVGVGVGVAVAVARIALMPGVAGALVDALPRSPDEQAASNSKDAKATTGTSRM